VSKVLVNGKSLTITIDPRIRTITREASGVVLSARDKRAVRATAVALGRFLKAGPAVRLANERALLTRYLVYLSEAPRGYRFRDSARRYSAPSAGLATGSSVLTETRAPTLVRCTASMTRGRGVGSSVLEPPPLVFANLTPCQVNDGDGIKLLPCNSSTNDESHDARSHCFETKPITSGPASGTDTGRCGLSGSPVFAYGYTQDCLDHDACLGHHGGSKFFDNSSCGDEFNDAIDDFSLTYRNQCAGSAGASAGGGGNKETRAAPALISAA